MHPNEISTVWTKQQDPVDDIQIKHVNRLWYIKHLNRLWKKVDI